MTVALATEFLWQGEKSALEHSVSVGRNEKTPVSSTLGRDGQRGFLLRPLTVAVPPLIRGIDRPLTPSLGSCRAPDRQRMVTSYSCTIL